MTSMHRSHEIKKWVSKYKKMRRKQLNRVNEIDAIRSMPDDEDYETDYEDEEFNGDDENSSLHEE